MSSEQPSTEEIKTSEEAVEANAPTGQDLSAPNQAGEAAGVTEEAAASAPQEEPQAETVAESAPTAETGNEESPQAAATSEQQEHAKTERKIQLKPKVDPEQFKAKPSPGTSVPPQLKTAEGEEASSEEASQEELDEAAMLQIAEAAVPIDIPPEVDDLGEGLEAELSAALNAQGGQVLPKTLSDEEAAAEAAAAGAVTTPAASPAEEGLAEGDRLKGKVESINNDDVFVDLGSKALGIPGIVPLRQFGDKPPVVGQEVDVKVTSIKEAEGLVQLSLPRGHHKPAGDWDAVSAGQVVECMVNKSNKGGLEVNVGSLRGFLPASQVDLYFVGDLEPFVGQKLTVEITEVNPKKRNLVVSRRKYLEAEREEIQKELWEKLAIGQEHTGIVKNIKDYGAFVDIGGIDGFLHIGEISWNRIKHPKDALSEQQQVNVKILKIDKEKNRISLGMKQLQQDPWQLAQDRYATDSTVTGKVTRTTDFGAFIELEPGLEGLVHISELDHRRINRVTEVLTVGQETTAKVLEVDQNRKRISLSLKALIDKPESAAGQVEDQPAYERKRKGPLLGGNAEDKSSGGGLFGNPNDFK
ncbi:S1 RNA-binding domain-containing protein [uncultured Gimesia sp.]|uniref:30S ribosomal protein S1 n=1 Tax=uncultured Gimesia sp. TaxID=1678688 RepID=UPI0030D95457|tara:strand:- start:57001 stop:58752 length:1752 start_codon:yes stop_codon:yes gene_type:complete